MFTGIVETVGRVHGIEARGEALRLAIESALPLEEMRAGESVAVDGVCLTVVRHGEGLFHADVIPETLRHTTLGRLAPGAKVNLERALRVGDRLGGHMVQGHVDATADLRAVRQEGEDYRMELAATAEIRRYVAYKGSITLQGVSLTVAGLTAEAGFEVALIPETLERTTLGGFVAGDPVNVEVDLVARYLERLLNAREARGEHG